MNEVIITRIWTIQPYKVWEIIQECGEFVCDITKSEHYEPVFWENAFASAYEWLVGEMSKKISKPDDITFPVWAWHTFAWKNEKPSEEVVPSDEKQVCLELEVPDGEVFLSDHEAWETYVLSNQYYPHAFSEIECDERYACFEKLLPDEREAEKKESWRSILDVTPVETDFARQGCYVQATIWKIKSSYVRNVEVIDAV